jgi:excinuclease UvrABC helicase subunit UvrB
MVKQVAFFKEIGKHLEAKRLEERTMYDLEMMRELGYCSASRTTAATSITAAPGSARSACWTTSRRTS